MAEAHGEGRPGVEEKTTKARYADEDLPVVWFWRQLNRATRKMRSDNIFGWFLKKAGCREESAKGKRKRFVDYCILGFLAFALAALGLWDVLPSLRIFAAVVVIVRLVDITNVLLVGDITPNRERDGELRKFVSSRWRYMLHTILTAAQVVLGFAVLFRHYGQQFVYDVGNGATSGIEDGLTALYQSFLTLTTLGYGEIHPDPGCWEGKAIVVWELALFIILLVVRMPMAIGLSYVKPEDETDMEDWEKYPAAS
jgi:hypothetical protein